MKNKIKKGLIFILVLIVGLILSFVDYTPKRDYTNLTHKNKPNIIIDYEEEYLSKLIKEVPLKWKLSKKRLTKRRNW